jgi:hypothetical protein
MSNRAAPAEAGDSPALPGEARETARQQDQVIVRSAARYPDLEIVL